MSKVKIEFGLFIESVRENQPILDKAHSDHKDKHKIGASWAKIAEQFKLGMFLKVFCTINNVMYNRCGRNKEEMEVFD